MIKKRKTLYQKLRILKDGISRDLGDNPIGFLDSGAIIKIDNLVRIDRQKDKSVSSTRCYEVLGEGLPLFVPKSVFDEVKYHHKHNKINYYPEIPCETYEIVKRMYSDYCTFLKGISKNSPSFDQAKYDSYIAREIELDRRKEQGDAKKISDADLDLVRTAAWASHSFDNRERPISSTYVFSSDRDLDALIIILGDRDPGLVERFGGFGYKSLKFKGVRTMEGK